jgi:3',5'-cyclic AMP phosphodiesterase CpdA
VSDGRVPLITHTWTDSEATIAGVGSDWPLRVVHLTDSHVDAEPREADRPYQEHQAAMRRAFADYDTLGSFSAQMDAVRGQRLDLLLHTGDLINYPSASAVAEVAAQLDATHHQRLFIAGNHDWAYAGLVGSPEALRSEWRERSLQPLYAGRYPHASSVDLAGVRFVAIDNSTYQIDADQLHFFERQLSDGLAVVLLVHIPFRLPNDKTDHMPAPPARGPVALCGDPKTGAVAEIDWSASPTTRAASSGNLPSTEAFLDRLLGADNLIAVLCGHTHESWAGHIHPGAVQYISKPGYLDGSRTFTILP